MNLPRSQYQNLLLKAKNGNHATAKWSAPKFMAYLFRMYVNGERPIESPIEKPHTKKHRRVDFEEMQRQRSEIGRIAEEYALEWEKERLIGAQLGHRIKDIEDRRDRPGFGHDFTSFTTDKELRFIEVNA